MGHINLYGIFPAEGWNPGLPDCRQILNALHLQASHGQMRSMERLQLQYHITTEIHTKWFSGTKRTTDIKANTDFFLFNTMNQRCTK